MTVVDTINGLFEVLGGVFILNHCRVLYNDKQVTGVSIISTLFFTLWGIWNLYFYPSLDQWVSFAGGIVITVANLLWVGMMVYYSKYYKRTTVPCVLSAVERS